MNNDLGVGCPHPQGNPADYDQQALFDPHENLRKIANVRQQLYDIAAREGQSRASGEKSSR